MIDQQNDFNERLTLLETRSRSRSASSTSMRSEIFDLSDSDDNLELETTEEWHDAIGDTESSFKRTKLSPIAENDVSESEYFSGSEVSNTKSATEAELRQGQLTENQVQTRTRQLNCHRNAT